jgi:hypothetical protein
MGVCELIYDLSYGFTGTVHGSSRSYYTHTMIVK